jgi:hypothetical protein
VKYQTIRLYQIKTQSELRFNRQHTSGYSKIKAGEIHDEMLSGTIFDCQNSRWRKAGCDHGTRDSAEIDDFVGCAKSCGVYGI